MVVCCVGLQRCGVINMRSTRTPANFSPAMNVRSNLNLNLNLNYNVRALNLPPLTTPTPARTPRGRKRRAPDNVNAELVPPPVMVERATPAR